MVSFETRAIPIATNGYINLVNAAHLPLSVTVKSIRISGVVSTT